MADAVIGAPWQNLIEAQFKVQLRLGDFKFEQAQTLEAVQNEHAAFIETFNTTSHWAHRKRAATFNHFGSPKPIRIGAGPFH